MQQVAKDYAAAIPELQAAARLHPDAPHSTFFLAIRSCSPASSTRLLRGCEKTLALGESPYLEESHFYLAKARLRQGDLSAARTELARAIERRGRLEAEARQLLAQIDRLLAGK
jgi:hypothetical protein